MKKEKIDAFKRDLNELLGKHKATIDITQDNDDCYNLTVFMKDADRGFYVEILNFPSNSIYFSSPVLSTNNITSA